MKSNITNHTSGCINVLAIATANIQYEIIVGKCVHKRGNMLPACPSRLVEVRMNRIVDLRI